MSAFQTSWLRRGLRTAASRADGNDGNTVSDNGFSVMHDRVRFDSVGSRHRRLTILSVFSLLLCPSCMKPTPCPLSRADSEESPHLVTPEAPSSTGLAQAPTAVDVTAPSAAGSDTPDPTEDTFLGGRVAPRVAIMDFQTRGTVSIQDAGGIVADHIQAHLSPRWITLIERAQLRRLLDEHDLRMVGIVEGADRQAVGRLANVTHLVVGSIAEVEDITVDARLVDVSTGEIVRRAFAAASSVATLPAALNEIAAVLSASDATYRDIERERLAKQTDALGVHPEITRAEDSVVIRFRIRYERKTDLMLLREARQKVRDLYVDYCREQLGATASKASLQDFCRGHEICEDVRTIGNAKEFVFRVPLPE